MLMVLGDRVICIHLDVNGHDLPHEIKLQRKSIYPDSNSPPDKLPTHTDNGGKLLIGALLSESESVMGMRMSVCYR